MTGLIADTIVHGADTDCGQTKYYYSPDHAEYHGHIRASVVEAAALVSDEYLTTVCPHLAQNSSHPEYRSQRSGVGCLAATVAIACIPHML